MATYCFINKCHWVDHVDNLFFHMELDHRDHIMELSSANTIKFNLHDFTVRSRNSKPILLLAVSGLYWFVRHKKSSDEMLLGVYHIGDTERINYTLQFGDKRDGWVMYYSGNKTENDSKINECRNDIYPISYFQSDIDHMRQNNCKTVKLILHEEDEWNYQDEAPIAHQGVDWCAEVSVDYEDLFCVNCSKSLRNKDINMCDNQHYICGPCMELFKEKCKTVKCPCCCEVIGDDSLVLKRTPPTPRVLKLVDDENFTTLENDGEPEDDFV